MEQLKLLLATIAVVFCLVQGVFANNPPTNTQLTSNRSSNIFEQDEEVLLICTANSTLPNCTVRFYLGPTELGEYNSQKCKAEHKIDNIKGCGKVMYSCMANNSIGNGGKANLTLDIRVKPTILVQSRRDDEVPVVEKSSLALSCSATGCPTPNVTQWTKQGQANPLETGVNTSLTHSFANVHRNDSGNYTCKVETNGFPGRMFTKTIYLDVQYKPEQTKLTVNKSSKVFLEGESVQMTCVSQANPQSCTIFLKQGLSLIGSYVSPTCSITKVFQIGGCGDVRLRCNVQNTLKEKVTKGASDDLNVTVNDPPKIKKILPKGGVAVQGDIVMQEGNDLTIQCDATGCPTPTKTWMKNGAVINSSVDSFGYISHTFTGGLKKQDSGEYNCSAKNELGQDSKTVYLNVTYKPQQTNLTVNKSSLIFLNGESVQMTCVSQANPQNCTMSLFYQGRSLVQSYVSPTCSITKAFQIDVCGNVSLRCEVENSVAKGSNKVLNVKVHDPLKIQSIFRKDGLPVQGDIVMQEGRNLTIQCNVTGCPAPTITWTKNGVITDRNMGNLQLSHSFTGGLKKQDIGEYNCSAKNEHGQASKTIYLNVTYKPQQTNLTVNKSSLIFLNGESVQMTCVSQANPQNCTMSLFYQGRSLVQSYVSPTCSITKAFQIDVCGNVSLRCEVENSVAKGSNKVLNVKAHDPLKIQSIFLKDGLPVQGDIVMQEGSNLTIQCNVTGCPTPTITWTKNGEITDRNMGNYQLSHSFTGGLKKQDIGEYNCSAKNEHGQASKTIYLNVTYKPEQTKLTVNKSNRIFLKGESVQMTCASQANPQTCTMSLYQRSTKIETSVSPTCSITKVFQMDVCGDVTYRCEVKNSVAQGSNKYLAVKVHDPLKIQAIFPKDGLPVQGDIVMQEGKDLTIQCNVTGCPTPTITWTKDGVITDKNMANLQLSHSFTGGLKKQDIGEYTCSAKNEHGEASNTIYLNVTYKPIVTLSESSITLTVDQKLNLTCNVDANPPATSIVWIRNGTVIGREKRLILEASDSLAGKYICMAVNSLGNSSSRAVVTVKGLFIFRITMVFTSIPWTNDYSNPSSERFQSLERRICKELGKAFAKFRQFIGTCKVLSFRAGSVIGEMQVTFNESISRSGVENSLQNALLSNNTLGELGNSSLVSVVAVVAGPLNPCKDNPCKNDGKCTNLDRGYKCECEQFRSGKHCESGLSLAAGIILIVLACLVVLVVIVIIVCCWRRRSKHRASFKEDGKGSPTELKLYRRRYSEYPVGITNTMFLPDDDEEETPVTYTTNGKPTTSGKVNVRSATIGTDGKPRSKTTGKVHSKPRFATLGSDAMPRSATKGTYIVTPVMPRSATSGKVNGKPAFETSNTVDGKRAPATSGKVNGKPAFETSNIVNGKLAPEASAKVDDKPALSTSNTVDGKHAPATSGKVNGKPAFATSDNVDDKPALATSDNVEEKPALATSDNVDDKPALETNDNVDDKPALETSDSVDDKPATTNKNVTYADGVDGN